MADRTPKLLKDNPEGDWIREAIARRRAEPNDHREHNEARIKDLEEMLNGHTNDCDCETCELEAAAEKKKNEEDNRLRKQKYKTKKDELTAKVSFKRGKVVVNAEDEEQIKRALLSIWNYIGSDVDQLYEGKRIPVSHIIEMVLDASRPLTIGVGDDRGTKARTDLTPTAEYVLRYSYEPESRPAIHRIAKKTFKGW